MKLLETMTATKAHHYFPQMLQVFEKETLPKDATAPSLASRWSLLLVNTLLPGWQRAGLPIPHGMRPRLVLLLGWRNEAVLATRKKARC